MTAEIPQPEPAVTVPPAGPGPKSAGKRWIALGTAGVLSAVVVGGGVGLAVLKLRHKPTRPVAVASKPVARPSYGALSDGNHFGSLSDLLLPVPTGDSLGPDAWELGNNSVLDTAQEHAHFDKEIASLSTSDRTRLEGTFDAAHIKGTGLRTYLVGAGLVVEITLEQENQGAARSASQRNEDLAAATGAFRAGPSVPGYPKTHCYLPPLPTGDKLDYLSCDASVGDILVTLNAYGTAPLDSSSAVDLLQQQLDRLAIPGAQT